MPEAQTVLFDPADPAFVADPYPIYAGLRAEAPVYRTPSGRWAIARYAECAPVLRDPRWSSDPASAAGTARFVGSFRPGPELLAARPFLIMDPPDHTRLRSLVSKAFTPKVIERLRPRIQAHVDELLDRVVEKGSFEAIEDLAYPLPLTVICEMLGVPPEDRATVREWSRVLSRGQDPWELLPPDEVRRFMEAMVSFMDYFRALLAERRLRPREDLLSALVAAEDAGDRLNESEVLASCVLLLAAGHETTVSLIGNGVLALLRHPDQLARLRAASSLAAGAVEEALRYDAPVQMAMRSALEDIEVGGETIGKGEQALVLLASANRDPARFPDADRFDLARADNHHLAFGSGIHYCLGAALGRLEGEIAFRTLARRFRELTLLADAPEYKANIVNRGLRALPVGFAITD